MSILLDSNILLRLSQTTHAMHAAARDAVDTLRKRGESLHIVPQNLYEFWVVATRPTAVNGLGFDVGQAAAQVALLQTIFSLLPDTPAVFPSWVQLVTANNIVGKKAHDARLVAAMLVHGVTHILTFNVADFASFAGVTVLDPASVAAPPTP
jgi:predicted nucleic acid-binding protein